MWPGSPPVLTARGLSREWERRGHGFILLRADALAKAVSGPLLAQLQAVFFAYEEFCDTTGVDPLALNWTGFVGGKDPEPPGELRPLALLCPVPEPGAVIRAERQP
jgi:hypothetical protein